MPSEPARKRPSPQLQPAIQLQPYDQAEFAGCTTNVPEGERLQRLRDILQQRASARPAGFTAFSIQPDLPSVNGSGSYRKDTAVLTEIPADAAERVALAKQLVDNGEEARWTKEPRGHSSFWSIVTACRPSGPPLIKDLFALAKPKDRYESLRGVPLEATLLLQHKGLLCRLDILQGNPGMAGPGLWAYRDPPIVKYARAGSQAMVLALLEAGAKVDHCLMWHEETCGVAKTTTGVATRHSWQQHARATTTSAACSSVTAPARTTNAATTMICTTRRRRLRRDAAAIPRRQRSSTASLRDVSSIPCTRAESCAPGSSVSSWLYQRTMRFSGFYGCMMLRENKVRPHGPRPSPTGPVQSPRALTRARVLGDWIVCKKYMHAL